MPKMDAAGQLALLKKMIVPAGNNELPVDLSRLEKIIKEEIPHALGKNAPANFPELYFDFEYVYSKLYDFLQFNPLIDKTVIALGGGFSSGKSTFLNTMLGNIKILPTAIRPSTSVPTYVIHGDVEKAGGINAFAAKVNMNISDIRAIAHGFGETEESEDEITLGHLMRSIFVAMPQVPYQHIAFLDTPGYSKAGSSDYSAKTDEKLARSQLKASDIIFWFIAADLGVISREDIRFLRSLPSEIPKLIIMNKIDKVQNQENLSQLRDEIRKRLDMEGIIYEDIYSFTRNPRIVSEKDKIGEYLSNNNRKSQKYNFAYKFKKLFISCQEYYDGLLDAEQRKLSRLNRLLTIRHDDEIEELAEEHKKTISKIKEYYNRMKGIQTDFFTELKSLSEITGISMPEPTVVDLLEDRRENPLNSIRRHNKMNQELLSKNVNKMFNMLVGINIEKGE